jgi:hypothetical protein
VLNYTGSYIVIKRQRRFAENAALFNYNRRKELLKAAVEAEVREAQETTQREEVARKAAEAEERRRTAPKAPPQKYIEG